MTAQARAALEALGGIDSQVEERILRWLRLADSVDLDLGVFAQLIGVDMVEAERIAGALAEREIIISSEVLVCVGEGCGVALSTESLDEGTCRSCGADLNELEPREEVRYVLARPRARDTGWLIALHGIRTRGPWQEQLQWLVDRQFRRTIPFKNWKYGRILFHALVPALQRRVVRRFIQELRLAQDDLTGVLRAGSAPPPDVVAHSFGTWVVAHAVRDDPTLRLGHVVLVGSVVRPDWRWTEALERNQITALLNYCGGRDVWVRVAERFIPDSGPSGSIGFKEQNDRLINILRPNGTHSSAFSHARLPGTFEDVWRPFFSDRPNEIDITEHEALGPSQWTRRPLLLRAPAALFVGLAVAAAIVVVLVVAVL